MGLDPASTPRGAAVPPRTVPFATRRRLVVAFALTFAAFLAVLAVEVRAVQGMGELLDRVARRERELALALEIEDAIRDWFGEAASLASDERRSAESYRQARERVSRLTGVLASEPDQRSTASWMSHVQAAVADLDRALREVDAASPTADAVPSAILGGYAAVVRVEERADSVFQLLEQDTAEAQRELVDLRARALRWTTVLAIVTAALIAGAVAYLSRSVATPLARLSAGAAALKRGDLSVRIQVDSRDEFGLLARELNEMTTALAEHQRRLVEAEKLAVVGRVTAGIAHELNNPLQALLGYLSLPRAGVDPRLAERLDAMEREVVTCRSIVEGLLELARPDVAGARAPVDLRELCEDVARSMRVAAGPVAGQVAVEGAGRALADRVRIRQVIVNLVRNALEAGGPGGRVEVRIEERGSQVEVAVCDSGPGVPTGARARLFEPFYTTKPLGTGLGLAVSRAIARANGGDVDLGEEASPGATFVMRLPRCSEGGG